MQSSAASSERQIDALLAEFMAQPLQESTYRELEARLREAAAARPERWAHLAGVYECRIQALPAGSIERAQPLLQLAALLEYQLAAPKAALRRYREARALGPREPQALAELRRALARQGEHSEALLIAEDEEKLSLPPAQRAAVLAEIAALWASFGESRQAQQRYEAALSIDPGCDGALLGLAELAEARGASAAAAALHERRLARLQGPARAAAQQKLAALLPEADTPRKLGLLREALAAAPAPDPLRQLIALEKGAGNWERASELELQLLELLEPAEALELALSAAAEQQAAGALPCALQWAERAAALAPEQPRPQLLRAALARSAGRVDELCVALEALEQIEGSRLERCLELAALHERAGRHEQAARLLRSQPADAAALAALERCLVVLERPQERAAVIERLIGLARSAEEGALLRTRLGDLQLELGAAPAAEAAYREALRLWPTAAPAAERLRSLLGAAGRHEDLAALLEQLALGAGRGGAAAALWRDLGRLELEQRDRAQPAAAAWRRALECEPGHADALAGLRAAAARAGAPALALEAAEHELARNPPPARARELSREQIASAHALGDWPRARAAARAWSEREPVPEAFEALTQACRDAGDSAGEQAALESLQRVCAGEPERRARCLERIGDLWLERAEPEALEAALAAYRRALEQTLEEPAPALHGKLIDLLRRQGAAGELAAELERSLPPLQPEQAVSVRLELAQLLSELGEHERARAALEPALELACAQDTVAVQLEPLLAQLGQRETRAELLRRQLARGGELAEQRARALRLGELLLELGRAHEAAAALAPLADPARRAALEALYERALEAADEPEPLLAWWARAEHYAEGPARTELLLRSAARLRLEGRRQQAIECLARADRLADPAEFERVRRPLLAWVSEQGELSAQLQVLGELARDAADPAARAVFFLERARLCADALGNPSAAARELEQLPSPQLLATPALRQLRALARRAGAWPSLASALEALASREQDEAVQRELAWELAQLYVEGDPEVRDAARAEPALRRLLTQEPGHSGALDRLGNLLERAGRRRELRELAAQRLEREPESSPLREGLALRLARLQLELGEREAAARLLTRELARCEGSEPLAELLADALAQAGEREAERALLAARAARSAQPERRAHWLRRWLAALAALPEPPLAEQLRALGGLLELEPAAAELHALRLRLLRGAGPAAALADALQDACAPAAAPLASARRLLLEELLELCERELDDPARALAALERELAAPGVPAPAELQLRAARCAAALGERTRQIALLAPLVEGPAAPQSPAPAALRELALACAAAGEDRRAQPLLWRALALAPGDRELLAALAPEVERAGAPRQQLELLELRARGEWSDALARRALELAQQLADAPAALRWLRRWCALGTPPPAMLEQRLALERSVGEPQHALALVRALREQSGSPRARAEHWHAEAELQRGLGYTAAAQACLHSAVTEHPAPPLPWLAELLALQERSAEPGERLQTLGRLAAHPDADSAARRRWTEQRVAALAGQPETREQAAAELAEWIERDPVVDPAARRTRLERLLELCSGAEHAQRWCETAQRLIPLSEPAPALALRRGRARRAEQALGAPAAAAAEWEQVLAQEAGDPEALAALARLCERPGSERRLAEILEQLAAALGDAEAWRRAAELRLTALGDPAQALADLDRALRNGPALPALHGLRAQACRRLGRPEAELESLRCLLEPSDKGQAGAGEFSSGPLAADADAALPPAEQAALWLRSAELCAADPQRRAEAAPALRQALARAPADLALRAAARAVYEQLGEWQSAVELLREDLPRSAQDEQLDGLRQLARLLWDELQQAGPACEVFAQLDARGAAATPDRQRWAQALAAAERWPEAVQLQLTLLIERGERAPAQQWRELAELALARAERAAAERALTELAAREPEADATWSLRLRLHRAAGRAAEELADTLRFAQRCGGGRSAAAALAHAAALALRQGDEPRARQLYRDALHQDGSWLPAQLGAAELALALADWAEAERGYGVACALLRESLEVGAQAPPADSLWSSPEHSANPAERRLLLARLQRLAARAARERGHGAEALRHLELSLEAEPGDAPTLAELARLALELGAFGRARECLELQLERVGSDAERAALWYPLGTALEGLGELAQAVGWFERVLAHNPAEAAARESAVRLLERLGEPERALAQLEQWLEHAPAEARAALELRAARLQRGAGRADAARERLQQLVEREPGCEAAWLELLPLLREHGGAAAVLEASERALAHVHARETRAGLLWSTAEALRESGRPGDAARRARELLALDPRRLDAAELLAEQLGHAGDWAVSVARLEAALQAANPPPALAARLWEAIGRAYAGPLESVERAARAYRSALAANPLHEQAREALADVTAFDPAAHAESLQLQRELLRSFPGRARSWRALATIARHRGRDAALSAASGVLAALESPAGAASEPVPLVDSQPSADAAVRAASEKLRSSSGTLPAPLPMAAAPRADEAPGASATAALERELGELAGRAWPLPDAALAELWSSEPLAASRRKGLLRRERRSETEDALTPPPPQHWRAELLAEAAARALRAHPTQLRALLLALLARWPGSAGHDASAAPQLSAALQSCAPARALLLRIADALLRECGAGEPI